MDCSEAGSEGAVYNGGMCHLLDSSGGVGPSASTSESSTNRYPQPTRLQEGMEGLRVNEKELQNGWSKRPVEDPDQRPNESE